MYEVAWLFKWLNMLCCGGIVIGECRRTFSTIIWHKKGDKWWNINLAVVIVYRPETSCDMLYAVMCYNICWLMVGWLNGCDCDYVAVVWFGLKSEGISKSSFSVHSYFHLLIIIPDLFNILFYIHIQPDEWKYFAFLQQHKYNHKNNFIWISFSSQFKYGRCYYHFLFSVLPRASELFSLFEKNNKMFKNKLFT